MGKIQKAKKSIKDNPLKSAIIGLALTVLSSCGVVIKSWVNTHFANQELSNYASNHTMIQNDKIIEELKSMIQENSMDMDSLLTLEKSHR